MPDTSVTEKSESLEQLARGCPSRTRSVSAFEVWKSLPRRPKGRSVASSRDAPTIREECLSEADPDYQDRRFSSFDSTASLLVLDRVMSQSGDVSVLTSGRCSTAISPLLSPPHEFKDDLTELFQAKNAFCPLITSRENYLPKSSASLVSTPVSGARTVRRWLKDRREKKKEETRVHNAQLHATVSVASAAAAVAAITAATAAASSPSGRKNEEMAKMDRAVASAAALVAGQCVEAAKAMGANKEHLASVVSSAVNVRMHDDVTTLTAAAATALRGAATLKARGSKGDRNIAAVAHVDLKLDSAAEPLRGIPIPVVEEKSRHRWTLSKFRTTLLLMAPNFSS
ncbi:hypothetical protein MLD38_033065 [Melastoma candidum]|uniref:Uncharacterized protein n=1 Tax=Melastoma candidum TaxID=119954 RepID=A0ACB9M7M7_9MYRT|nr:hypothetical protein MLD38_033065 [Melastoma candidum]